MSDLARFVKAQEWESNGYSEALSEIVAGRKVGHWIWYIFPQLYGLGYSSMSKYYAIADRREAEEYLAHPLLGARLREISEALLAHAGKSAVMVLGPVDAVKVRSCMTLFDSISPDDVFATVLERFYGGERDPRSLV